MWRRVHHLPQVKTAKFDLAQTASYLHITLHRSLLGYLTFQGRCNPLVPQRKHEANTLSRTLFVNRHLHTNDDLQIFAIRSKLFPTCFTTSWHVSPMLLRLSVPSLVYYLAQSFRFTLISGISFALTLLCNHPVFCLLGCTHAWAVWFF